jgi:hypothetical protein
MRTLSPASRHRGRMLGWCLLIVLALLLIALPGDLWTASFNGRHLLAVFALAGLVLEAEWQES